MMMRRWEYSQHFDQRILLNIQYNVFLMRNMYFLKGTLERISRKIEHDILWTLVHLNYIYNMYKVSEAIVL